MNKHHGKGSLACLLGLAALLGVSCIYYGGCETMVRFEKEVALSAPLAPGLSFTAETRDGAIAVEGVDAAECRVMATITTRARTIEQAEELADRIEVKLESSGSGVVFIMNGPIITRHSRYDVSLAVQVPAQTSLALVTRDGNIHAGDIVGRVEARATDGNIGIESLEGDVKLETIDGNIACAGVKADELDLHTTDGRVELTDIVARTCRARTSDGRITVTRVQADEANLRTTDGSIRCHEINVARMDCRTTDGSVHLEYAPEAPKALHVRAVTSDGHITLIAPPELSAAVQAQTNEGSIDTSLPITVQGKVGKSLGGTVGGGEGMVYLRARDGSITIR